MPSPYRSKAVRAFWTSGSTAESSASDFYDAAGASPPDAVPQPAQNFAPGASSSPQLVQCAEATASAVPHSAQNLAPWALSAEQLGHWTVGGASDVPHEAQNLAPAALSAWQFEHFTVPGALAWAA